MTAFVDALDLKVAVSECIGDRDISDKYPILVKAAEAWFNKRIRHRLGAVNAVIAMVSGVGPLPANYLEAITVRDMADTVQDGTVPEIAKDERTGYSINGSNLYIYGITGNVSLDYYAALTSLTTSLSTSNWLLQKSPNLYLYAIAHEAAKWTKDTTLAAATLSQRDMEALELHRDEIKARFAGGKFRVRDNRP